MKPLLYVDGYNIIGAWPWAQRPGVALDEARDRLLHELEDYAGYTGQEVVLVFDGYKSERLTRSHDARTLVTVVYTKHAETADQYIERACTLLPPYREARVATSDQMEQTLILGRGATRLSARELLAELRETRNRGRDQHRASPAADRTPLLSGQSAEVLGALERLRREK